MDKNGSISFFGVVPGIIGTVTGIAGVYFAFAAPTADNRVLLIVALLGVAVTSYLVWLLINVCKQNLLVRSLYWQIESLDGDIATKNRELNRAMEQSELQKSALISLGQSIEAAKMSSKNERIEIVSRAHKDWTERIVIGEWKNNSG